MRAINRLLKLRFHSFFLLKRFHHETIFIVIFSCAFISVGCFLRVSELDVDADLAVLVIVPNVDVAFAILV